MKVGFAQGGWGSDPPPPGRGSRPPSAHLIPGGCLIEAPSLIPWPVPSHGAHRQGRAVQETRGGDPVLFAQASQGASVVGTQSPLVVDVPKASCAGLCGLSAIISWHMCPHALTIVLHSLSKESFQHEQLTHLYCSVTIFFLILSFCLLMFSLCSGVAEIGGEPTPGGVSQPSSCPGPHPLH